MQPKLERLLTVGKKKFQLSDFIQVWESIVFNQEVSK